MFVWTEKYRPATITDCVLTAELRDVFGGILKKKEIPNMMLSGPAGSGKTTVARALCNELDYDHIFINGSMNGNIDTLRTTIQQFASAVSFSGSRKCVILDEADYLNPQSTQPALRGFMEEFAENCAFILTCNFKNKIIEPLHSRCTVIDFSFKRKDKQSVCSAFLKRMQKILEEEGITYNKQVLANVIINHYPDLRKVISECQIYTMKEGMLNEGILAKSLDTNMADLVKSLKAKKYQDVRTWVVQNLDNNVSDLLRKIYDGLQSEMVPQSIPAMVLFTRDSMYKAAFIPDPELVLLGHLTEIMSECEFK